jgi:uncharacterized protein (TIGR02453 family)
MIQKSTLDFLKKLKKNNNREWFNSHKNLFENAKQDFEYFIGELIQRIIDFNPTLIGLQPKECLFRIYKDVRFSKDKKPYKLNFGASIGIGGRNSGMAGYYFHVQPGNQSFLAGGLYMPSADKLKAIRKKIVKDRAFYEIIDNKTFKKYFKDMWGDKLKTAPQGYPKDHPDIELLKLKHYLVYSDLTDEQILSKNILDYSAKVYEAMSPLIHYLNDL